MAYLYNGHLPYAKKTLAEAIEISTKDSLMREQFEGYNIQSYIALAEKDYATSYAAKRKADSMQQVYLNGEVVRLDAALRMAPR